MPATAGRVRMPANNRVHSSAALQTHGIWQSAIGYDPYAPNKDDAKDSGSKVAEPDAENAYASFQGLLALARITNKSSESEVRGACQKCGRVGHLTFQCRNFLRAKDDKDKDLEGIPADVLAGLEKFKAGGGKANGKMNQMSDESSEEEESETSDSDVDSEMERAIAERYGKKHSSKSKSSKKKKKDVSDDNDGSDYGDKKKRGRSKKRRSKKRAGSDSDEDGDSKRKRRKERRKKKDLSSEDDEEERSHRQRKSRKEKRRRRRSHRYTDDSDESSDESRRRRRRKSRRATSRSNCDASGSDDSRVGRGSKRTEQKRKRSRKEDE